MRALIVDDSPAARELGLIALEAVLEELGVKMPVLQAENGVSALKHIAAGDIGVLLVDLHMPDLHGLEVLSFWQQKKPERAMAFVVSTQVSQRDHDTALATGASGFLEKPVTREALKGALAGFKGDRA